MQKFSLFEKWWMKVKNLFVVDVEVDVQEVPKGKHGPKLKGLNQATGFGWFITSGIGDGSSKEPERGKFGRGNEERWRLCGSEVQRRRWGQGEGIEGVVKLRKELWPWCEVWKVWS